MPYLFCKKHGDEHEARTWEEQESYRQLGESVVIARGTLISGPWECDSCNVTLKRGKRACLMTAFPRAFAESMDEYDFSCERQYFDMKGA
jgi:hypothetical protein